MKIGILGHFAKGESACGGQVIKTRIIEQALLAKNEEIAVVDSYKWKKHPFKFLFDIFKLSRKSDAMLMLPDAGGVKIYPFLLKTFLSKKKKCFYVVIGGWLPNFLKKRKLLTKTLKRFDGILVETDSMKKALEEQGFTNVIVMPNCKNLKILKPEELVYPESLPYKLCTFSRVMKEKGIENAVNAVKQINEEMGKTAYTLDIYGQVDPGQSQWFDDLKASFPPYVNYCGVVNYDKSVDVLKNYFALLFPTHYYTEGVPGTIIDAYAAGVPVISAKWESFADVIDDKQTGFVYEFGSESGLVKILHSVVSSPKLIDEEKLNCIAKARLYLPENVISILLNEINR